MQRDVDDLAERGDIFGFKTQQPRKRQNDCSGKYMIT